MAQSSGTNETFRGISCPDVNTCTVVGENGPILHTTDGGATWTDQSSGMPWDLASVSCTDANTCTAAEVRVYSRIIAPLTEVPPARRSLAARGGF
jgi:photosystem II stability/assembly factor-like uncharacterized protein